MLDKMLTPATQSHATVVFKAVGGNCQTAKVTQTNLLLFSLEIQVPQTKSTQTSSDPLGKFRFHSQHVTSIILKISFAL